MIVVNKRVFPKERCCPAYQEGYEPLRVFTRLVEPELVHLAIRDIRQPDCFLFGWALLRPHQAERRAKAHPRPRKTARAFALLPVDHPIFWPGEHVQPDEVEP